MQTIKCYLLMFLRVGHLGVKNESNSARKKILSLKITELVPKSRIRVPV